MSVSPISQPSSAEFPGAFGEEWWREVKPLAHAMVYKVRQDAVLKQEVKLPDHYRLESWWPKSDRSTLAVLASETNELKWAPSLREMKYDLFIAHLNRKALPHLLFLTSSRHGSDALYRTLAEAVLTMEPPTDEVLYHELEVEALKWIYSGAREFEFINLGMDLQQRGASVTYSSVVGHDLRPTRSGKEQTGHPVVRPVGRQDSETAAASAS
jgi:hypothetical protein